MNAEMELNLQAYLDGELSSFQARNLEKLLAQDKEAQLLLEELKMTKSFLAGNEMEVQVPESREFYWSKIHREIQRESKTQSRNRGGFFWNWRKYLYPVAGAATALFIALMAVQLAQHNKVEASTPQLAVVENLSDEIGSYSFRSQNENMFVVWVYNKTQLAEPDLEYMDQETAFQ